jgi:hypothetical protein
VQSYHLCLLAEACKNTGRLDDALSALREALAAADEHEIRAFEAEIYRLKGELLLKQNDSNTAEVHPAGRRLWPLWIPAHLGDRAHG